MKKTMMKKEPTNLFQKVTAAKNCAAAMIISIFIATITYPVYAEQHD